MIADQASGYCCREEKDRAKFQAIDPARSMWCLDEGTSSEGRKMKTLLIVLIKPEASEDEVMWKKGVIPVPGPYETGVLNEWKSICKSWPSTISDFHYVLPLVYQIGQDPIAEGSSRSSL